MWRSYRQWLLTQQSLPPSRRACPLNLCMLSLLDLDVLNVLACCAEQAHNEMRMLDSRVAKLQAVALHTAKPESLQDSVPDPSVPSMPDTRAVLHTVAASEQHPGAILRLAGDRRALDTASRDI